jgi:hypothetical protein
MRYKDRITHDNKVTLCLLIVFFCTCILTPILIGYGVYLLFLPHNFYGAFVNGIGVAIIMFFVFLGILMKALDN